MTNIDFLNAIGGAMPDEERLILCSFAGDPGKREDADWRPCAWHPVHAPLEYGFLPLGPESNNYVAISSFTRDADYRFRRRKANFGCLRAVMVDDVGSKIDRERFDMFAPPGYIEILTSPGNSQAWYLIDESPEARERPTAERFLNALLPIFGVERDPGMLGCTRVGRLPVGINGKARYTAGGELFRTRIVQQHNLVRYTLPALAAAFGIVLDRSPEHVRVARELAPEELAQMDFKWALTVQGLAALGLLDPAALRDDRWIEIECPWIELHTDRADNGAAIHAPSAGNNWQGAFRCHHHHGQERGPTGRKLHDIHALRQRVLELLRKEHASV